MAVSRVNGQPSTALTIHDRTTLNTASSVVHDGVFRLSDIAFDDQSQVFRLVFYLPDKEQTKYRRVVWPVSRRNIPFTSWELTFSSVQSCDVKIENNVDVNSLLFEIASIHLHQDETKILVVTHFVVTIELVASVLSGEVRQLSGVSPIAPLSSLVIRAFGD